MEAFGDLFRGVRARGSLFGSSTLSAPWALRFVDGAPLRLCTVLAGSGWTIPDDHLPEHLTAGALLIVRGPAPFTFVDRVGTEAEPVECGEHCATPEQGGTRHRLGWNDGEPGDRDAFAFSAAFKRVRGVDPTEFRRTGTARGWTPPETEAGRGDR